MTRVLVGGVGYRNLRDHSFGIALVDALSAQTWPAGVEVEDISYNPIAVVQRLQDQTPDERFDLVVIGGALPRPGRLPGTLSIYRWDRVLPAPEQIHQAITEAVTGIIALDNTLVIARHFDVLPATVVVVEIEPAAHECGDSLTPEIAAALEQACETITRLARDPAAARGLPEGGIVFERPYHSGVVFGQFAHDEPRIH